MRGSHSVDAVAHTSLANLLPAVRETDPVVCPSLCVCRDHEAYVSQAVLAELKRIVDEAEVVREDDNQWPEPDRNGRQVCSAFLRDGHGLCRLRKTAKGNLPVYHASCCERPLMTISRLIFGLLAAPGV